MKSKQVWEFRSETAKYIVPRLTAFYIATKNSEHPGIPSVMFRELFPDIAYDFTKEQEALAVSRWLTILEALICTFELIAEDSIPTNGYETIHKGLQLFATYYLDLWS